MKGEAILKSDQQGLILGIWDGHDAGAALFDREKILFAINEERLTRRKLEVGFPKESIKEALRSTNLTPESVKVVSYSTTDFSKTLTRCFPELKEQYYQIRRRKVKPSRLSDLKRSIKYKLTELPPNELCKKISSFIIDKQLKELGFENYRLLEFDHHYCHAISACFTSGFSECLVVTLDGLGDGLSGSVWSYRTGKLDLVRKIAAKNSLGIFFEHVTNLLNMRELEDEGKVMALANFASPIPDAKNPMLDFFSTRNGYLTARYSSLDCLKKLKEILWHYPSEQFAYMAQRALEVKVIELISALLVEFKHKNLAYSGGVASNIKVNMLLSEQAGIDSLYVFPHMGDGGLAIGAGIAATYSEQGINNFPLPDVNLGPSFTDDEIEEALKDFPGLKIEKTDQLIEKSAELLLKNEIILWFQGRMELGPRALGMRSILAVANSESLKDELNLKIKRRVWYQPFCPAILEEDASWLLSSYKPPPNLFMTCGFKVAKEHRKHLSGVINVDGTCRPVILPRSNTSLLTGLLLEIKKQTGVGALLNTSFNLHGEPLVCSPTEALTSFIDMDVDTLVIGNFIVNK